MNEDQSDAIKLIDVVKFEIKSVQANKWLTENEKQAKIKQLKSLVPNHPEFKK